MSADTWIDGLNWAMEILPFPALGLYVIALGMLWLGIEAMASRFGRSVPNWHRPIPILPLISEIVTWLVRGSSWLLWIWMFLYFAIFALHQLEIPDASTGVQVADALLMAAGQWRTSYQALVNVLPDTIVVWTPGL